MNESHVSRDSTAFPIPITSLIGRENDVVQVTTLLQSGGVRLLTLMGPGGVGKTRLALQVAAGLHTSFADGAYFVSLAPVGDPDLVLSTIAQTLGVRETPGQPLSETLCNALSNRHLLLILDNFEQIVAAAPYIVELLVCAPKLQVLVTSRTVLHVYGEQEYPVSPLALPEASSGETPEQLTQYESVRLFIERARAGKPLFKVNNSNAPAVAEICHRLDGLPLAIELAAARIKFLSPKELLTRLDKTLPMLTGGPHNLPRRHQTLRNAIEWSYDLLGEGEKRLFKCLSVFSGGCSLEAAERVCGGGAERVVEEPRSADELPTAAEIQWDALAALVDKSLLRHEEQENGEVRFLMLETIREYAQEQLAKSEELTDVERRHLEYFLQFVERAESEFSGHDQIEWLDRLAREHNNLRAALQRASQSGDAEMGLRMGAALVNFWYIRGYRGEGRKWLSEILEQGGAAPAAVRAKALNSLGNLSGAQSDYAAARTYHEQSLALWREVGNDFGIATATANLANSARLQGDFESALALFRQCLELYKEQGNAKFTALTIRNLGIVFREQGDYAGARKNIEEAIQMQRGVGDKHGLATSLDYMGMVAHSEGNYKEARAHHEESLALWREFGDKAGEAGALQDLGEILAEEGDSQGARALQSASLRARYEVGTKRGVAHCLQGLAVVDREASDPLRLARLIAASEELRAQIGAPVSPRAQEGYRHWLDFARTKIGAKRFAEAWEEGKALSLEDAVNMALDIPPLASSGSAGEAGKGVSKPEHNLTPREIEVLRLVAAGLTNPGIAVHLQVSINTVQTHLRSVFSKINVTSRVAAVRYAFEHSLE